MGRETKILLALLATLGGVFLGVLSMKLFVPRPPLGAGPDVHVDVAAAEAIELVDPPSLSAPAPGPVAARSAVDDADPPTASRFAESQTLADPGDLAPPPLPFDGSAATPPTGPRTVAFTDAPSASPPTPPADPVALPRRDPFVAPAAHQMPISEPAADTQPAEPQSAAAAAYVANPGDSWWDLAERAYGDGRLYRALFAWNRVIDPRVSLTPGTKLEIPSRARLEAAWPKLMPTE